MKRCIIAGCDHYPGYQSSGDTVDDFCQCHFFEGLESECEGNTVHVLAYLEVLRMVYEDAKKAEINARSALAATEKYRRDAEYEYDEALWRALTNLNTERTIH